MKGQSRLHQLGSFFHLQHSSDAHRSRGEYEREIHLVVSTEDLEYLDASEMNAQRPDADEQNCLDEIMESENPL